MACLGVLMLLGSGGRSLADDIPKLVGTWTAHTRAVLEGNNLHRHNKAKGAIFPKDDIVFRYVVEEQEDSRFAGEMSGGGYTETFVGDVAPPGYKGGVMAGHDGIFQFTIRDADTLDVCYAQFGPTKKIADCFTLSREK